MENNLLTVSRMARRLGVETSWLRAEAEAGRIPGVKAGKTFLFDAASVERVLLEWARRHASDRGAQ